MRPLLLAHLLRELGVALEASVTHELGVELGLDRAERDVLAVGALVHVVEVGAGVEQIGARPVFVEDADLLHRPEHAHQRRRAVDHGRVDDLTLAAALGFQERTHHPVREEHASPAEVADHVERWHGRLALAPEVSERTGE